MREAAAKRQSRSEAVRSKRNPRPARVQYTPQQLDRASRQARKPVASRPITSRGVVMPGVTNHTQRRLQSNTRRVNYIPLRSTPGAELRLPALPGIRLGWRLVSFAIVLVLGFGIYSLFNSTQFMFHQPEILGAARLTAEDIATVLDVEDTPAVLANPTELARKLEAAYPELESVDLSVGFPASLTVKVKERQPVLSWNQEGKTAWVDPQGYVFEPRGDTAAFTLVNVNAEGSPPKPVSEVIPETGADGEALAAAEDGKKVTPLIDPLAKPEPAMESELVSAIISLGTQAPEGTPIVYNPEYGLGWDDPQGWKVFFGRDVVDMELKMAQYSAIVEQLQQQGVTPALISVEYPRAPFYRLEQ